MKKIIVLSGLILASAAANASFLLWQVSTEEVSQKYTPGTVSTWDSARIYAFKGISDYPAPLEASSALQNVGFVADNTYTAYSGMEPAQANQTLVGPSSSISYVADISNFDGSSYSFFVELWNTSTSQRVGYSNIQTVSSGSTPKGYYADTAALTAALGVEGLASANVWHASSYGPVPEPTSAMLMLFGAAFLGLKRKNRRIA